VRDSATVVRYEEREKREGGPKEAGLIRKCES
jgi:hypothetical protein